MVAIISFTIGNNVLPTKKYFISSAEVFITIIKDLIYTNLLN
jgi:hypothetical protein